MTDFNSKYTGEQVEQLLDQVASGDIGGGIETETDPIFSASPAASITEEKKSEWDRKQDEIADLDTIRSGAEKGATALQEVPSDVVRSNESGEVEFPRGMLVDNYMGMWYALPLADGADKEDADAILAWYSPSGDLVMQTGVLVDNNEGHRYALPYASEEDKAGADSVIASEAYVDDKLDGMQPTLVSGENIKTINGASILGSGNIEISGGGGGSSAYPVVNHSSSETLVTIAPNTFHIWDDNVTDNLTIRLGKKIEGVANEYLFQFTAMGGMSLTLQDNIKWNNGETISIIPNSTYQVSILEDIAVYASISLGLATDPA